MDRIGRYKIVRERGRGARCVVYHAIDPNIGRPVAIKTINLGAVPKAEDQERMRERLFREARSAGILSHPVIVTIYDVEQQGDLAYIGRIAHLDLTLVCEAPRIGTHRDAMRAKIAALAGIAIARVAVKATTSEKLGFTGRGEGIAAYATATVRLPWGEP